jgi:hypothetical protein
MQIAQCQINLKNAGCISKGQGGWIAPKDDRNPAVN